jgi:protein O-GlcNAc transferase
MSDALQRALEDARSGRLPTALAAVRLLVQRKPGDAEALQVLGLLLVQSGQHAQAVHHLQRAVAVSHGASAARNNLGNALAAAGRHAEAIEAWQALLAADPAYARAWLGLVGSLIALGRFEDAVRAAESGLALKPDWPELAPNHALALQGADRLEEAVEVLARALARQPGNETARSNLLLLLNYVDRPVDELLHAHLAFGSSINVQPQPPRAVPAIGRPLRVGILSGDLRTHSVGFFARAIIEHAPAGVECIAFATARGDPDDSAAAWFRDHVDAWVDVVAHDDAALDAEIRDHRIDVLVELSGHTAGTRLTALARKPAPVIVTAIGYPNTTGLGAIDARLVDAVTDPPGSERLLVESPLRIDPCFLCYAPPAVDAVPCMPAPDAPFTFGSFNIASKLRERTVRLWRGALDAVPGSRLLLKSRGLDGAAAADAVRRRFAAGGVDPSRLDLLGATTGMTDHLALYRRMHVALDPTPYNGTTTTCEALWMGVPVITLAGDRHAARVGASLLHAVGLDDLVAKDEAEFASIAAGLAADDARRMAWRRGLRSQLMQSPLADAPGWASRFHAALAGLHQAACARDASVSP